MIIDTHQHAFWQRKDDAGLVADMDEHGIDVAWLLTWEIRPEEDRQRYHHVLNPTHMRGDGSHAGIPLCDLVKARDRYPDRFIVGYCPHPLSGNAAGLFESAYHMHGVRVCAEWKFRMLFDDPRCINLFRKAGELRCPVVLHLDVPYRAHPETGVMEYTENWYGGTVANLERALQACPETNFIGHAPGFWREISGDADTDPANYPRGPVMPGGRLLDLFDRYPNLYADLSAGSARWALARDSSHALTFIERYQDRLLFARDIYGSELHDYLETLDLSEAITRRLYSTNAQKLVPLDTVPGFTGRC